MTRLGDMRRRMEKAEGRERSLVRAIGAADGVLERLLSSAPDLCVCGTMTRAGGHCTCHSDLSSTDVRIEVGRARATLAEAVEE